LKVENVQDRHRSTGRLFQAHGPATARARSPMVERRVAGTRTLAVDAESSQRRECMPSLLLQDLQNANTQIRRVSGNDFVPAGQCAGTPRRACATVKLLRQETPNFLASNLWPSNSPDLSLVNYEIWAVMEHRVYHRQIHSVDELKRRLIDSRVRS